MKYQDFLLGRPLFFLLGSTFSTLPFVSLYNISVLVFFSFQSSTEFFLLLCSTFLSFWLTATVIFNIELSEMTSLLISQMNY